MKRRWWVMAGLAIGAAVLTLLARRPLGLSAVTNPLPAEGGADREEPAEARRNAPEEIADADRATETSDGQAGD